MKNLIFSCHLIVYLLLDHVGVVWMTFISRKNCKIYENTVKCYKFIPSFTFPKLSAGTEWSLSWANPGPGPLCVTPSSLVLCEVAIMSRSSACAASFKEWSYSKTSKQKSVEDCALSVWRVHWSTNAEGENLSPFHLWRCLCNWYWYFCTFVSLATFLRECTVCIWL